MIRLLALDLDGTLIDRQQRLPEAHRLAVQEARQAGIDVVFVTGRSWRGALPYYEALELDGPAILYLGAVEVSGPDGRLHHYEPLDPLDWDRLRAFAEAERLSVTACVGADHEALAGRFGSLGQSPPVLAADVAFATRLAPDFDYWDAWNPYTEVVGDLGALCPAPPLMVAAYGDQSAHRLLDAFPNGLPNAQFDLTDRIAGETVLHIWRKAVDKGTALARYCAERGYRREEVCAMGDGQPDVAMFPFAGISVSMPDSRPEVRAAATWQTDPDDPHPVATAIRRILGGR